MCSEQYLECGILAHGFARARCDDCGPDYLLAFSCEGRGACPSCNTRLMAEAAAHRCNHVFPQPALWGSSFLFMRLGAVEFGALPTAGVRVAIASLFLLPLLLWHGVGPQLARHRQKVFFIGLLNSGIPFALFAFALLSISTGLSSILNAAVPLFGALVAWVWSRTGRTAYALWV